MGKRTESLYPKAKETADRLADRLGNLKLALSAGMGYAPDAGWSIDILSCTTGGCTLEVRGRAPNLWDIADNAVRGLPDIEETACWPVTWDYRKPWLTPEAPKR